jgi:hypothetical protein
MQKELVYANIVLKSVAVMRKSILRGVATLFFSFWKGEKIWRKGKYLDEEGILDNTWNKKLITFVVIGFLNYNEISFK